MLLGLPPDADIHLDVQPLRQMKEMTDLDPDRDHPGPLELSEQKAVFWPWSGGWICRSPRAKYLMPKGR